MAPPVVGLEGREKLLLFPVSEDCPVGWNDIVKSHTECIIQESTRLRMSESRQSILFSMKIHSCAMRQRICTNHPNHAWDPVSPLVKIRPWWFQLQIGVSIVQTIFVSMIWDKM